MVSWDIFNVCNGEPRAAFEDMSRMLFRYAYLQPGETMHSNPNNPGIEVEPVWNKEHTQRISFQSKYFDSPPDYSQIYHSMEKTVHHYRGKVDHVYLYCNKKLNLTAGKYKEAENLLSANGIRLTPICCDEILDQVRENQLVADTYFSIPKLTSEWIIKQLERTYAALGKRYNREFNISTKSQRRFDLFLNNDASADILNQKKNDVVKELRECGESYGEGRQLARRLLAFIDTLQDVQAINMSDAYQWYHQLLDECGENIRVAKQNVENYESRLNDPNETEDKALITHKMRQIQRVLTIVEGLMIDTEDKEALEAKVMLVAGDAGMGKSQLFANTSAQCVQKDETTILLLGSSFLNNDPIGKQIIDILALDCSFDTFLNKLEGMAKRKGRYSYILIDALNECGNKTVWMSNITQLIKQISEYERIKIAISLRTGYDKLLFGDQLDDFIRNGTVAKMQHQGFRDESIVAIREFMNHFQIPFLPYYALSAELTNPLYLSLFCQNYTGDTVDVGTLIDRLQNKADMEARKVVGQEDVEPFLDKFISEFIELRLEQGHLSVKYDDLLEMKFWTKFGLGSSKMKYMASLRRSGLFSVYVSGEDEYFSFAYQKVDDYMCAKHILKQYPQKKDLVEYMVSSLLDITNGQIERPLNTDIVIELCTLFRIKYGEELFDDIIEKVTDRYNRRSLVHSFLRSFSWRMSSALSVDYVFDFLNAYNPKPSEVFDVLIENCGKENHPLNADTLHNILMRRTLAERDYLWTTYINYMSSEEKRIYQLMDYFEKGEVFESTTCSINEKLLILFIWLFTSSNRRLRDKATMTVVELLKRDFIKAIYLCTPERVVAAQKINWSSLLTYDEIAAMPQTTLHEGDDGIYRFSFSLADLTGYFVCIELYPQALTDLLSQSCYENVSLIGQDGQVIAAHVSAADTGDEAEFEQFLADGSLSAIIGSYCFVRTPLTQLGLDWQLVYTEYVGKYFSSHRMTLLTSVMAFVFAQIIAFVLGNISARWVIAPLRAFIARVRSFRVGADPGEYKHGLGLREGIFLYVTISVSLSMLVFILSFSSMNTKIQELHRRELTDTTLLAVSVSLEGTFDKMRDTVIKIASDYRVKEFVHYQTEANHAGLEDALRDNANAYSSACTLRLISRGGELLYSSSYLNDVYLPKEMETNEWYHTQDFYGQSEFSLNVFVYETNDSLICTYNYSVIAQQLDQLSGEQGKIYLVDAGGRMLDGSGILPEDREYVMRAVGHMPWFVAIPYESVTLMEGVMSTLHEKTELVIALLLSAVFLAALLSSLLLAPLARLSAALRTVGKGQLAGLQTFAVQRFAIDELSELNESFIEMADRIELLIDDLVTSRNHLLMLENIRKKAEINALQMQITPHFLSNTIMLITDRINTGNVTDATSMLYAVNRLFRYGIARRDLVICVSEEWAYAQSYAQIMAARKEVLRFEWDADERAMERATIRLILQPLIENAIYHGSRKDGSPIIIRVSCRATQDETFFSVSDNGPGLTQEKMEELRRSLNENKFETSIGLFNVQSRIRLYCGEEYGVSVENNLDGGAIFTLRIPSKLKTQE